MKTKLLLLVAFLVSALSMAQCDYTLELTDNFGNDWDSGTNLIANTGVDVTVDGVTTTYLILEPSPNVPATTVVENYTITVNDGDAISIDYRATSFPGDGSFRLIDSEGIEVYASPFNQVSMMDIFTGAATCPTCFAVTTLTTNNITADGAEIGWTATGNESAWEVEYGPENFTPGTGITVNATSNPWTIDGLMSETIYDVYVRADCGMGDISSNQGPISFTTIESCPAPSNFASQDETALEIQFVWDANGNTSTNYEVNYGEAPFNQGDAGGQTVSGFFGTFALITGLTSNTEYSFYVRYDCGNGDFSNWAGPYTQTTEQSCPDIEDVVFSNIDQTSVDIEWTEGGTETEWEIEYGPAPLTPGTGTTVVANTNSFTLTGLMSGTAYDICITAVCATTDRSTPVCAEVLTPADYCAGDQLVDSGGPNGDYSGNEDITYTVCPDNMGDVVYVQFLEFILEDSGTGCWDGLTIYDGPDTNSPIILTPDGDEEWCWDVTSGTGDLTGQTLIGKLPSGCLTFVFESDGFGQRAGFEANVTCAAPPTCPVPFEPTVAGFNANSIDIEWTPGGSESEWTVEYGVAGFTAGTGTLVTPNPTTAAASINGLDSDTEYDFIITAICGVGDVSSSIFLNSSTSPDYCAGDQLVDSGGANGDYSANEEITYTVCPDNTGDVVYVEFLEFILEDSFAGCFDGLTIYDGPDTNSPIILTPDGDEEWCWDVTTGTGDLTGQTLIGKLPSGCLTFVFDSDGSGQRAGFTANVTCAAPPTCPVPFEFTTDSISSESVDLSWSNGGGENAWEIEYVDAGEAQGTGTTVEVTTNPFTLTGLTSSTSYDFYLRAICAVGDESLWTAPLSVRTAAACGDVVFDTGGIDGDFSNNENYSTTYLPENAGDVVSLTFTALDLPTTDILSVYDGLDTSAPVLDADVRATGLYRATNPDGALTIQFISNGFTTGDGWEANYTCDAPSTCFEVSDIDVTNITTTEAEIAWTSNGTESLWDIEFVEQGSTPTGTPTESATTNPYTSTSLSSGTFYDVYIRANCGNGDVSLYTGPFAFATLPDYCAGDLFLDSGGATGAYQNNETITYNICPDNTGDVVYVNFISNEMEDSFAGCFDGLTIYDGPDATFPIITTPDGDDEWCWDNGTGTGDLTLETLIGSSVSGCLTFVWSSDGSGQRDGWEANVTCAPPPTCDVPTDLSFSTVNSSSFDFTWTDNASASEFIVEYREVGATAFTAVSPNPTTNSVTISSLTSATDYEVCVTAVCDLAANDLSIQVCGTVSTTPDYCAGDLFLDSGGATGQYENNETITYNICPDNAGDVVYVDFISNQMEDSFAGCFDGLTIYDGPDATFPIITTPSGDEEWCWDDGSGTGDLTLETLIGSSTSGCLTFVWSSDGSGQRDGWEANVTCAPPPACPDVNTLTATQITNSSAVLSWTEVGTASVWQVEVQPVGVAQGTTGAVYENLAATNPENISGLDPATTYDFFVRSDCGMGDLSGWVGPISFTTACAVVTQYPYVTDFTTNVPNQCWDEAGSGEISDGPLTRGASDWRENRAYENASGTVVPSNAINLWQTVDREWLISESFDMSGTSNDVLTVEVAVTNYSFSGTTTVADTMGSDDQVDLLITTDGGTTWTSLMAWTVANQPSVSGELMTFDLSSYTGTVQFAFLGSDGTVDDPEDYDFHVGVFEIDGAASNDELNSFDFTFYPNPTSDVVEFNSQQIVDTVTVRNLLGQELLITRPSSTSSSVDLSTFPSGMYLIEVVSGEKSKVVKVMRK